MEALKILGNFLIFRDNGNFLPRPGSFLSLNKLHGPCVILLCLCTSFQFCEEKLLAAFMSQQFLFYQVGINFPQRLESENDISLYFDSFFQTLLMDLSLLFPQRFD